MTEEENLQVTEVTEGENMIGGQEAPETSQESSSGYMTSIFNTFAGGKKATPPAAPGAGFMAAVGVFLGFQILDLSF